MTKPDPRRNGRDDAELEALGYQLIRGAWRRPMDPELLAKLRTSGEAT